MKWREHCIVSAEKVTPVTICEVELNQVQCKRLTNRLLPHVIDYSDYIIVNCTIALG